MPRRIMHGLRTENSFLRCCLICTCTLLFLIFQGCRPDVAPVDVESQTSSPQVATGTSTLLIPSDTQSPTRAITVETPALLITPTPLLREDADFTPIAEGVLEPNPTFTNTNVATPTRTPTRGFRPTRTETPTSTVTPTAFPQEAILKIIEPGRFSKLISPLEIDAEVTRGEDGYVYLTLMGENDQIFASQELDFKKSLYNRLLISQTLEFSITSVAELARLVLETHDIQGRIKALSSVDLILLSLGDNEINSSQGLYQTIIIDNPVDEEIIRGSRLFISGRASVMNDTPLIVELLNERGEVIASRTLQLAASTDRQTYTAFVVELSYTVSVQTRARLSIRQESDNEIQGTVALSSVAVILLP